MPERLVNPKLLRLPSVKEIVALSRTNIYHRISLGDFPKPIPLGGRAVAWLESDVLAWVQAKVDAAVTVQAQEQR